MNRIKYTSAGFEFDCDANKTECACTGSLPSDSSNSSIFDYEIMDNNSIEFFGGFRLFSKNVVDVTQVEYCVSRDMLSLNLDGSVAVLNRVR